MNEQLKQAIEENLNKHRHETILNFEGYKKRVNWILQDPNILRHADPEIMKQAGWVRANQIQIPLTAIDIDQKKIVDDGCMITSSGILVNLFNPNPESINLVDIAHQLAHTCRWNGGTKFYFSVAEHCVRMYDIAETQEQKATALFHDAEEAYWGDVISPLKKLLPQYFRDKMKSFRDIIFKKFNIQPIDEYIERLDKEALAWEFENLIKSNNFIGWLPNQARNEWLIRAFGLLNK